MNPNISISKLPTNPGVYLYKNNLDEIIYVGKAKNLKNRIRQYFQNTTELSPKTRILVSHITKIEYILVNSEVEALLLENKLIKQHKPKYNINLKDDKTYAYLKITSDVYPKLLLTRKFTKDGEYFGPFASSTARRELLDFFIKYFQVLTPESYKNKSTLNYQIGLVPARLESDINLEKYLKTIEMVKSILKGNISQVRKQLTLEMQTASNKLQYELALERKKQAEAVSYLEEKQYVDTIKTYNQDVFVYSQTEFMIQVQLFSIIKGTIISKKLFTLDSTIDSLPQFLIQFYSTHQLPQEILLNKPIWDTADDKLSLEQALGQLTTKKIELLVPVKGDKKQLIELALLNLKEQLQKPPILDELQKILALPTIPRHIEFFDMSNLGSKYLVGALTKWVNGERDSDGSRKFEIKSFKGKNDDFGAMREVILRRYTKLKKENSPFPDLIIVDGGKGQLSAALDALKTIYIKIPVIGLAKKEEELYLENRHEPLRLNKNSPVMLFIRKMRDTTHNYVISYNRKKRSMEFKDQTSDI